LRICFLCNEYPPGPHGGIGTVTRTLGRALVAAGHHVRVIGCFRRQFPGPSHEVDQGVEVWRLRDSHRRFLWVWERYQLYRRVAAWCRRGEIDLIELPDAYGMAAAWPRLPVPLVVRLHGSATYFAAEMGRRVDWRTEWLERSSFRRADYCCSTSRYTADKTPALLRARPKSLEVVYNSVNVPELISVQRTSNEVVFAGTLTVKKGIVSLIRAWPGVLRVRPDARLSILGKDSVTVDGGSMQAYLQSLIGDEIRSSITFHGHQPLSAVMEALQRAAVAIYPSYAEAFAVAPLEAMACACPTIYSRRGSGPELIEDGVDGLLIDPDKPEEITSALLRVLGDSSAAKRWGAAGRRRVEQSFSTPIIVAANERFFRACIDAYPRQAPIVMPHDMGTSAA
jgi:glycosyltransferase involved in cell wall biosynthesis